MDAAQATRLPRSRESSGPHRFQKATFKKQLDAGTDSGVDTPYGAKQRFQSSSLMATRLKRFDVLEGDLAMSATIISSDRGATARSRGFLRLGPHF